jgi:hypothetical protein
MFKISLWEEEGERKKMKGVNLIKIYCKGGGG